MRKPRIANLVCMGYGYIDLFGSPTFPILEPEKKREGGLRRTIVQTVQTLVS